jgi:hypothetical protein
LRGEFRASGEIATPTVIEYWYGDSKTLTTADDIDAMRQVFIDATYAMGGVPRD